MRGRRMIGLIIGMVTVLPHFNAAAESPSTEPQSAAGSSASSPAASAQSATISLPKSIDELPNESAAVCLNYATILFYNARGLLYQGKGEEAKPIFQKVGDALRTALKRSENDSDGLARALVRGQASFMLGDLSLYVFKDRDGAKAFYEESLRSISDHAGARTALDRLSASEICNQVSGMKEQKSEDKSPK